MTGKISHQWTSRPESSLQEVLAANHRRLQVQGLPWMFGVVALGLLFLLPPVFPFAMTVGVVAFPVLTIAHAVVLRLLLVNPARRAFRGERTRRLLTRWTCRLGFLAVAPAAYSTLTVPGISALVTPVAFFGLNLATYRYLLWQGRRHLSGQGTHPLEKVFLVVVTLVAAVGLVAALAFALLVGLAVDWIM